MYCIVFSVLGVLERDGNAFKNPLLIKIIKMRKCHTFQINCNYK